MSVGDKIFPTPETQNIVSGRCYVLKQIFAGECVPKQILWRKSYGWKLLWDTVEIETLMTSPAMH